MPVYKTKFGQNEMKAIVEKFRAIASSDIAVAKSAGAEIAKAIETPLRQVLLSGDIVSGIYTPTQFKANEVVRYQLDLLTPGQEREFYAYVIPDQGALPQRRVESDYLMIPTFMVGNAIDCTLKILRDANWPIISRMLEILEAGFIKKINDDGWQTIIAAATDRNILVNDPNAVAGQFTPRLVTLIKQFMRRNGGGNSATINRSKLTDLYVSPEGKDDIRSWGLDLIPDAVREKIFYSSDDNSVNIFDVKIHDLDELGVDQEYQLYYTAVLGGVLDSGDTELAIGLDLQRQDSFVMPVVEDLQVFEDNTRHRANLFGLYGRSEHGFAVLDSRRTILASF